MNATALNTPDLFYNLLPGAIPLFRHPLESRWIHGFNPEEGCADGAVMAEGQQQVGGKLSNIAVARIILGMPRHPRRPGFMTIPLEMTSQTGLALLAVLLTSTPGTSWLEYNSKEGTLLIHVLDLDDEEALRDLIKNRYERILMEVFE